MKKIALILTICTIAFSSSLIFITKTPDMASSENERISGAYEALNFFGDARSYPEKVMPAGKYHQAWKTTQSMKEHGLEKDTDPWESMGPHNRGGRTLDITFNPQNSNTLYAGSASGGLWRSYSAGVGLDAWEYVETGHPVLGVSVITFIPGDSMTMFIGTGEVYNAYAAGTGAAYRNTRGSYGIGILKSIDGGENWYPSLDFSYDQNKGIWDIEVSPTNPQIIFASTTDGVYKSTDQGESWDLVLDVIMSTDLIVHPEDENLILAACGNFSSPGFGIYKSSNGGDTWVKIISNLPTEFNGKIQLRHAPSNPDIVYASIGNGFSNQDGASWLCRSLDFGTTWELRSVEDYSIWQGWFAHDVAVHPTNPQEVIAIGITVWKSTNGGANLTEITTGGAGYTNPPIEGPDGPSSYVHSDCHDVEYHPDLPDVIYVANDGGIHRSLNGGQTWESCNGRLQTAQFYNGSSNSTTDSDLFLGGLQDNGTIRWNGEEFGTTWTRILGGDGSWSEVDPQDDNIVYASSQFLNVVRIEGANYDNLAIPGFGGISFIAPYAVAPSDGDIIYAARATVAKSVDKGESWEITNGGQLLDGNPVLSISIASDNPNVVYAGTAPAGTRSGAFVTRDGGATWKDITGDLPDRFPMDVQVDPSDEATAFMGFSGYGTGHIFRTRDFGESWEDLSEGLPDLPINAITVDPLYPNNIYVGNDIGVYVSVDDGYSWERYSEGMPTAMIFDLEISLANRKLRAATHGSGAFQRDLIEEPFTAIKDIKSQFDLKVFPNPSSDIVNLNFETQKVDDCKILLNSLDGIILKTLFQGKLEAGTHNLRLDVSAYAPGSYILQLMLEDRVITRKLIIQ